MNTYNVMLKVECDGDEDEVWWHLVTVEDRQDAIGIAEAICNVVLEQLEIEGKRLDKGDAGSE